MPTLREIRRKMLDLHPELGELYPIASLTATTVVVTRLGVGTMTAEKYKGKWLVRAEAASQPADRERLCSNYTASSGTLTHAGTNYGDTTATSEYVEILKYPVWRYDKGVDEALRKLRFTDRTEFPTVSGQSLYYLGDLAGWVDSANRVERVTYSTNPLISRDRFIEKWATVNSSGVLQPDHWTLAGSGATVTRVAAANYRSRYVTRIARSGTNCTLTQTPGLLLNGTAQANGEDLRGKVLRIVGVGTASAASQLRFQVGDGTQTVSTSYHTGGGAREELTTTITVATTATTLTIAASVETTDGNCDVEEIYVVESDRFGDGVRRNDYQERECVVPREYYRFGQVPGEVSVVLPSRGRGSQYVFYTSRPYPQFDSTRLLAGTADADSSDAPLVPVATLAIAELYRGLIGVEGQDDIRNRLLAGQWEAEATKMAARHKATEPHPMGVEMPGRGLLGPRPYTARGL